MTRKKNYVDTGQNSLMHFPTNLILRDYTSVDGNEYAP